MRSNGKLINKIPFFLFNNNFFAAAAVVAAPQLDMLTLRMVFVCVTMHWHIGQFMHTPLEQQRQQQQQQQHCRQRTVWTIYNCTPSISCWIEKEPGLFNAVHVIFAYDKHYNIEWMWNCDDLYLRCLSLFSALKYKRIYELFWFFTLAHCGGKCLKRKILWREEEEAAAAKK